MTRPIPLLAALLVAIAATGCQSRDPSRGGLLQPYRQNIPQGNYVDQQMLSQVKPGMTRDQVRFALGSPLLTDVFHPDRWDYVFRMLYADGTVEQRRVTVHFGNDRVERVVAADPLPAREGVPGAGTPLGGASR